MGSLFSFSKEPSVTPVNPGAPKAPTAPGTTAPGTTAPAPAPAPAPGTAGGRYRPTKKDKAALRKLKKGKSIGFTMRSSLKAKGLLRRKNGRYRVSAKYR